MAEGSKKSERGQPVFRTFAHNLYQAKVRNDFHFKAEPIRDLHWHDLLDEERDVPEGFVPGCDCIVLGLVCSKDITSMDENELARHFPAVRLDATRQ